MKMFKYIFGIIMLNVLAAAENTNDILKFTHVPDEIYNYAEDNGKFSYIVSIQKYDYESNLCIGTMINQQWIITSAFCIQQEHFRGDTDNITIQYYYPEVTHESLPLAHVDKIIIHKNYSHSICINGKKCDISINDISLIQTKNPVYLLQYALLPSPITITNSEEPAITIGWGYDDNFIYSHKLQLIYVSVLSYDSCNNRFNENSTLTLFESNICAITTNRSAPFHYHIGTPILVNGIQEGMITSNYMYPFSCGPNCYLVPNVNKVSYYVDWINQQISMDYNEVSSGVSRDGDSNDNNGNNGERQPTENFFGENIFNNGSDDADWEYVSESIDDNDSGNEGIDDYSSGNEGSYGEESDGEGIGGDGSVYGVSDSEDNYIDGDGSSEEGNDNNTTIDDVSDDEDSDIDGDCGSEEGSDNNASRDDLSYDGGNDIYGYDRREVAIDINASRDDGGSFGDDSDDDSYDNNSNGIDSGIDIHDSNNDDINGSDNYNNDCDIETNDNNRKNMNSIKNIYIRF